MENEGRSLRPASKRSGARLRAIARATALAVLLSGALACGGKTNLESDDDGGSTSTPSSGGASGAGSAGASSGSSGGGSSAGTPASSGSSAGGGSASGPGFGPGSPPSGGAAGGGNAGGGGGGSSGGSTPGFVDASRPMPADASVRPAGNCSMGGGGGGGGGGVRSADGGIVTLCETFGQEICGGSTTYQVACACPEGTCACFGPSTTVVSFPGCPSCPSLSQAFAACGFPQ